LVGLYDVNGSVVAYGHKVGPDVDTMNVDGFNYIEIDHKKMEFAGPTFEAKNRLNGFLRDYGKAHPDSSVKYLGDDAQEVSRDLEDYRNNLKEELKSIPKKA
jgi:hypothetical protein